VFGSVARGDAVETSDVDLLVAPGPDTTLFDLSGFALDVEEIVGRQVEEDLDAAFEQAREQGDVTPLVQTVKRWWFEADAWRDPQAQREYLARIDTYRDEGPPPAEQRMSREEIRARFGV
jgi:predicted nucleotidyltransferase